MGTLNNGLKREWLRLTAENARLSAAHRQLQATIDRLGAEIERLRAALEEERMLKQGWIDEFVKLRDMGKMPPDEYGVYQQGTPTAKSNA